MPVTVNEVFAKFKENDPQHKKAIHETERYGEIGNFYSNIDSALSTGWKPMVSLKTGIKYTIDYFKSCHNE